MRRYTCDGCFQDIEPGDEWHGHDKFPGLKTEMADEDDDDPVNDEDYQYHFHGWGCVWVKAGREVEGLPSIPLGDETEGDNVG